VRSARGSRWPRAPRLAAAATALALCLWLVGGLTGRRLGELEAFLPPADLAATEPDGELAWIVNDYDRALTEAQKQNRPLLIDFTGYTCTNCRWMEANMFPRPDVARELARFVRVRLYTDGRGEIYRRFQQMEQDLLGTVALPYYAVIAPDGTPALAFGGLTRNADEFIAFLREGWNP
jgi:thiol:disulfide interchange protein DsbD